MLQPSVRRTLLATTIIASSLSAAPALAQTAPTPAEEDVEQAIVVTGSRVSRPNTESPSPITTVSAEEIKEFGATKIEDLTNALPQVFAGQSTGVANGADGTATVDLRGLGSSRTLVLIDGRRLMPGNIGGTIATAAAADLNFIPASVVSSVDLLTGGASAAYGADAVAGVVNFKMNRDFKGVRLDAQYSVYQHNNNNDIRDVVNSVYTAPEGNTVTGGAYNASIALGSGFDDGRGRFVVYAGYRNESEITQDEYDYSYCTLNASSTAPGVACGGSGTPARTRIGGISAANAALAGLSTAGSYTLTSSNTLVPYVSSRDAYNFGPLNHYRRPSERYNAGAFAEYEISDALKPYVDVMFMDYSTQAQIAPSGAFYGTRTTNCDNPYLTSNQQVGLAICGTNLGTNTQASFLLGKRNVEGGARFNDIGITQYRIVTGMKGDLGEAWAYDAYYQFGQVNTSNVYRNDVSSAKIDRALQVVNVNGTPTCQSVVDGTDPSCVPYNVFSEGGVTSAAANYINVPLVITGRTRETVVSGALTGDLSTYGIQSPLAEDAVRVSLGAEYRTESLKTQPDQSYINGDGAGQGGPTLPIDGSYRVTDLFTEAGIPLVTDRPFFHDLSIELGFRYSWYDVTGADDQNSASTYKIAGNWSPIPDVTLRGSYNRAVRSPNISELFSSQNVGLFSGSDPCAGTAENGLVNGYTAAQCARTGVTAAQFGNIEVNTAEQYNQITGGNIDLNPEKADTYSVGVVFSPTTFLSGLVLSVDYYYIDVQDAVSTIGSQVILNQCVNTGDDFFCSKINRVGGTGAAAGSLWLDESGNVSNLTVNTGSLRSSGIDVNGSYRTSIDDYRIRWEFAGTWLDEYVSQPLTDGFEYDCAGYYGITCGNPAPEIRFNTNIRITTPDQLGMTLRWRYLGPVTLDTLSEDTDLSGPDGPNSPTSNDDRIKPYHYFDLLFSLPLKDTATLRLGVNNIFDVDPPIISQSSLGGFGNGNTFPGTYDTLGRYLFVNLTADF